MGKWFEVGFMVKPSSSGYIFTDFMEEYEINDMETEVSVIGHGRFVILDTYTCKSIY